MLNATILGRPVEGHESEKGTEWRYPDGVICATVGWRADSFRYAPTVKPCPECSLMPGPTGVDPCLGVLPGVTSACCGHGPPRPVILEALTPSEMAVIEGDALWRALDIVETMARSLGRVPTGREVVDSVRSLAPERHPGYVHLNTALRTAEGAT